MASGEIITFGTRLIVRLASALVIGLILAGCLGMASGISKINDQASSNTSRVSQSTPRTRHSNVILSSQPVVLQGQCEFALRDLDGCAAQLIGIGKGSQDMPMSMVQLNNSYCPKFKRAVDCVKTKSECFSRFEQQIIAWVLTSSRRMNHKRCRNEGEKEKFLRLTNSCFHQMESPMGTCMNSYIASLELIADLDPVVTINPEADQQIQLSCCANSRFKDCVMKEATNSCRHTARLKDLKKANSLSAQRAVRRHNDRLQNSDMMDDVRSTLEGMALTGPEFICNNIDEKFCKQKFDPHFTIPKPARHKSILPAMLKIYMNK